MAGDPGAGRFGEHRNAFGFLRLLFATLVIAAHTPELADGDSHRELLFRLFGTVSFGVVAVDGFFLISGYLIVGSYLKAPAAWPYLGRRIARIYPAFLLASVVSVLIVAPVGGASWRAVGQVSASAIRKMLTLQPPVVGGAFAGMPVPVLNGSTWTISAEFRCYLLVLVLGALGAFRQRWLIALLAILAAAALGGVPEAVWRRHVDTLPWSGTWLGQAEAELRLTSIFLVGACFRLWRDEIDFTRTGMVVAAIGLGACLSHPWLAEPALATFGGYLLFACARLCRSGPLATINNRDDISYGVYLYAWPIEQLLFWHWPRLPLPLAGGVTIAGAYLCGWLSWHGVEKPVMQRLRTEPASVLSAGAKVSVARYS